MERFDFSKKGREIVDVKNIYFKLEPRDLSSAYKKYCGKNLDGAHRAENDVKATIEVLEAQLTKHIELPKDVKGLNQFGTLKDPLWIDDDGKLTWNNGEATINFGKYSGKTLEEIYKTDKYYLNWMINQDFSSAVKDIITVALEGKFPQPSDP